MRRFFVAHFKYLGPRVGIDLTPELLVSGLVRQKAVLSYLREKLNTVGATLLDFYVSSNGQIVGVVEVLGNQGPPGDVKDSIAVALKIADAGVSLGKLTEVWSANTVRALYKTEKDLDKN